MREISKCDIMRIKKSRRENYGVCVAAEKEICVKLMESHYDGKSVISAFKETAVMDKIWEDLYGEAKKVLKPRKVSEWVEAGGVAAAIEAASGRITQGFVWTARVRSASARNATRSFRCSQMGRA